MNYYKETIERVEIGKYFFEIMPRESSHRPELKFKVIYAKKTPKARVFKHKVIENYGFPTLAKCEEYVENLYRKIYLRDKKQEQEKAERQAKNAEVKASDFYKVGDIVYTSWGYEQTNVNFCQIVKMTAKTIWIKEISLNIDEDSIYSHGMAYNVTADKNNFKDGGMEFRLRVYANGALSTAENFYRFSKWDGTPKYRSTYY